MRHSRHIGNKFGELTLLAVHEGRGAGHRIYGLFRCDCGKDATFAVSRVVNGQKKALHCGCKRNYGKKDHGMGNSREYSSWMAMRTRCLKPHSKDYPRYGGRGITVYPEWAASFKAFYKYIGPRPEGTTLDRIDPDGNYEPGNVRWATVMEQAQNRKTVKVVSTPMGTMFLVDYARRIGLTRGAAHLRLKRGKLDGVSYV